MGNEQSQQSRLASDSLLAGSDDFNPDNITNTSGSEAEPSSSPGYSHSTDPTKSPLEARRLTSSMKRKEKQRKRKRRPSTDASILTIESEGADVTSTPHREEVLIKTNVPQTQASSQVQSTKEGTGIECETLGLNNSLEDPIAMASTDNGASVGLKRTKGLVSGIVSVPAPQNFDNGGRHRYPCPKADQYDCRKTFTMLSSARRHGEKVHPDQTFKCSICSKEYRSIEMLGQHQRNHSEEEVTGSPGHEVTPNSQASPENRVLDRVREQKINSDRDSDLAKREGNFKHSSAAPNEIAASIPTADLEPEISRDDPTQQADLIDNQSSYSNGGKLTETSTQRKRKRAEQQDNESSTGYRSTKKRMRNGLSTPSLTSTNSGHDDSDQQALDETSEMALATQSKPKAVNSGNLDGFAQPWKPGSQLHHPTLNPRSPRGRPHHGQVLISAPSSGSSSRKSVASRLQKSSKVQANMNPHTPSIRQKHKALYSSNNGKARADPDTEYSSPTRRAAMENAVRSDEVTDHDDSDRDDDHNSNDDASKDRDSDPENLAMDGLATSVARRTSTMRESEHAVRPTKRGRKRQNKVSEAASGESERELSPSPSGDVYLCQECHRRFSSRKALRKHETTSGVHKLVLKCDDCNKSFGSRTMLQQHQQELEHGDGTGFTGRKGAFSRTEIHKLITWRDRFCDEYDLTHVDFNNMMTDSCRRSKGFFWPYRFISKADFLQEYYDVLPGRNRRSMHRYRERAFQNVISNQQWTDADDKELADLVGELGPRWVEIGQRMSRTQDSVNQRWRHKVQYRGKQKDGEWLQAETDQLMRAVTEVKQESGISLDPHADVKMPWESVSKKLKGSRTAQQCSNKWRLLHSTRIKGVFLKTTDLASNNSVSSSPGSNQTPSRMSQRLSGQQATPTTSKRPPRRFTSEKYVQESDSESSVEQVAIIATNRDATPERNVTRTRELDDRVARRPTSPVMDYGEAKHKDLESRMLLTGGGKKGLDPEEGNGGAPSPAEVEDENTGSELISEADDPESPDNGEADENPVSLSPDAAQARDEDSDESNHAQDSISGEESSDNDATELPRNPFSTTTPRNRTTLSQAFNQTQANTSAVKAPRASQSLSSQASRPSPNVPIRTRVSYPTRTMISDRDDFSDEESSAEDSERGNLSHRQSHVVIREDEKRSSAESSGSPGSGQDLEISGSSDSEVESDNDTMVEDTRKESFLQSLRQSLVEQQQERHGQARNSSQSSRKPIDWQQALRGGSTQEHDSSDEDDEA